MDPKFSEILRDITETKRGTTMIFESIYIESFPTNPKRTNGDINILIELAVKKRKCLKLLGEKETQCYAL